MQRDLVFLSYSHSDAQWLGELQTHLKPYVRHGSITAWSDLQIRPGSKWLESIREALSRTKVAVLLVSPDFLASDFIHDEELTPLLKDAQEKGVRILWFPLRPSSYQKCGLDAYQALVDPAKPLVKMRRAGRDEAFVHICKQIEAAMGQPIEDMPQKEVTFEVLGERVTFDELVRDQQHDIVKVNTTEHVLGVAAEYAWVRRRYPKSKTMKQELSTLDMITKDKRYTGNEIHFDVLTIKLPDGQKKKVYFDISSFFGLPRKPRDAPGAGIAKTLKELYRPGG